MEQAVQGALEVTEYGTRQSTDSKETAASLGKACTLHGQKGPGSNCKPVHNVYFWDSPSSSQ